MAEHMNFQFTCPLCGGHNLSLPEGYDDSSVAECGACGTQIATWGQLKAAAVAQAGPAEKTKFQGLSSIKGSPTSR